MSATKRLAIGAVALFALLTMVGLAGADTYTTDFESPTFTASSVDGQDGWHSAVPGDIPALPNGYDQAVVDNSGFGQDGGPGFGDLSLRVSNAYSEPTDEFFYQTYSPSKPNPAGETESNRVFDGQFDFISTSASQQPGLMVSVSPDNGSGGRMSYVSLTDTASGVQVTFYETAADGSFVGYDVGTYSRNEVHTIRFLIETVTGEANDIVRLYIDGVDQGDRLGLCFTTWEQWYREGEGHEPGVIDSFEFRADNTGTYGTCDRNGATKNADGTCVVSGLAGGGYLFDNVTTETRADNGPAPTTCGQVGLIAPTGTTCQQYRDGTAPTLDQLQYTTKGEKINAVSPGVFFYYTKVSGDLDDEVNITQDHSGTAPVIPIQKGQVVLYNADTCKVVKWTVTSNGGGNRDASLRRGLHCRDEVQPLGSEGEGRS
jgi:hypothetical protein